MDMFEYIATEDPAGCSDLCNKYGYQVQAADTSDLGDCMSQLVREEGEPALKDLVALHPDKDLILEMFGQSDGACSCAACAASNGKTGPVTQEYLQQAGASHQPNSWQTHHAGFFIIGGLLVVTLALISTK